MTSLLSVLTIARNGVAANTAALTVTSQNVAGASSSSYVARTARIESVAGGGVAVTGVVRSFDRFSFTNLVDQQGRLAAALARSSASADLEGIVSPTSGTLADRANDLLDALHQLAASPTSTAVRSAVIGKAQNLTDGFSSTASSIASLRNELFEQARSTAGEVNDRLSALAAVDRQITATEATGAQAADLRDRREQLVGEIGQRIGARVIEGADGGVTLFGAGTVLYEGGTAATLSVGVDTDGRLAIQAERNGHTTDVTGTLDSGTLAGLRDGRDVDVAKAESMLDSFAYDLAGALNAIHSSGVGLDGVGGRPLFAPPSSPSGAARAMTIEPSLVDHPERVAAAGSSAGLPGDSDVAVALARAGDLTLGAGGTVAERYASLASMVGTMRNAADGEARMREDTVATATALRASVSGVSTDEEMVKLQQFQQGFDASMKVMKTVSELFDSLMSL
jgi:flagellar hook-associated protein 1 FlgK